MAVYLLSKALWFIFGGILIALELIVPGAILVFLGIGALLIGIAITFGLITTWPMAITSWFIISLVLIFTLRALLAKYISGETEKSEIDEDVQAVGEIALVTEDIPEGEIGRINFRDTTWSAKAYTGSLTVGTKVKIVSRENINWIVEKYIELD